MKQSGASGGVMRSLAAALLALAACAGGGTSGQNLREGPGAGARDAFDLAAPDPSALSAPLDVWGTQYFTLTYAAAASGVPLLGAKGEPISAPLSARDWCHAALEGSVIVASGATRRLYNYADHDGPAQADCSPYIGLKEPALSATERVRFVEVDAMRAPYGCGVERMPLVPFRTIAVDRDVIATGTVLFVPAARGAAFTDESGAVRIHDGYFFAGDIGGVIRGTHVDVFTGGTNAAQLPMLVTNREDRTTPAYVVPADSASAALLRAQHAPAC